MARLDAFVLVREENSSRRSQTSARKGGASPSQGPQILSPAELVSSAGYVFVATGLA